MKLAIRPNCILRFFPLPNTGVTFLFLNYFSPFDRRKLNISFHFIPIGRFEFFRKIVLVETVEAVLPLEKKEISNSVQKKGLITDVNFFFHRISNRRCSRLYFGPVVTESWVNAHHFSF